MKEPTRNSITTQLGSICSKYNPPGPFEGVNAYFGPHVVIDGANRYIIIVRTTYHYLT
jgi:hypothetical protein